MSGGATSSALLAGLAGLVVVLAGAALRGTLQPGRLVGQDVAGGAHRTGRQRIDDVIEVADRTARGVRSGRSLAASLGDALDAASGSQGAFLLVLRRHLRAGGTLASAVRDASGAATDADERLLAQTLQACATSGGDVAAPIERAAGVLRERRAWRDERRAQGAQARLSAQVMTLLPVGFAAWGLATSASVRAAYVGSPIVVACAGAGLLLNLVGWRWMRRLVDGGR